MSWGWCECPVKYYMLWKSLCILNKNINGITLNLSIFSNTLGLLFQLSNGTMFHVDTLGPILHLYSLFLEIPLHQTSFVLLHILCFQILSRTNYWVSKNGYMQNYQWPPIASFLIRVFGKKHQSLILNAYESKKYVCAWEQKVLDNREIWPH